MLQGFVLGNYVLGVKTLITMIYNQAITRNRYIRDTYKELDISELPPGEVAQTSWNGEMIFIRRLTKGEVDFTNSLPNTTLIDKSSKSDPNRTARAKCASVGSKRGLAYLEMHDVWRSGYGLCSRFDLKRN